MKRRYLQETAHLLKRELVYNAFLLSYQSQKILLHIIFQTFKYPSHGICIIDYDSRVICIQIEIHLQNKYRSL